MQLFVCVNNKLKSYQISRLVHLGLSDYVVEITQMKIE